MKQIIKSNIPKSRDIQIFDDETVVYDNGEPFIYDHAPYSTYLFIFPEEQFTVYSTSMIKAIKRVEKLKGGEEKIKNSQYAVINLTNDSSWHGSNINQSKRNNVVNHLFDSLFNIK